MIAGIECPYCKRPMYLIMGNPVYTYWICVSCKTEFEYNVFWEKITEEVPAQDKLLNEMDGRR